MKMLRFLGKRGLAVFTSLVLCTSLVLPSFAASFSDLQEAIRGNYTGTAFIVEGNDKNRTVTLQEDVTRGKDQGAVAVSTSGGIALTVTIDLAGYTIDGTGGKVGKAESVFRVKSNSILTIEDSTAYVDEETGEYIAGKITGGTSGNGGGVYVEKGSFILKSGIISGNRSTSSFGGGVYVKEGKFTMDGGVISGNTSASSGGGVAIEGAKSSFVMKGGEITGNTTTGSGANPGGGGVLVKSDAKFTMEGGAITGNSVTDGNGNLKGGGGGVAVHQGVFEMLDGIIKDNMSGKATGVQVNATEGNPTSYFEMSGGFVSGDGESCIYLEEIEGEGHDAYFKLMGEAVLNGKVYLGKGTQIITDNVMQPDGDHPYTGFDVTYQDGSTGTLEKKDTESTETNGGGYEAEDNTFADVKYECTPDETAWVVNGTGHSHPCKTCQKPLGDAVPHNYGVWSDAGNGEHSRTCELCGAVETSKHSWGEWEPTDDGRIHYCTVCGAEETSEHIWGGWTDNGEDHSRTCTVCGATETEGHNYGDWSDWAENEERTEQTRFQTCGDCGAEKTEREPIKSEPTPVEPAPPVTPVRPAPPIVIDDPDVPLAPAPEDEDGLEEIEDDAVPLAGLFTRADAIGYLWEQAGSPDAELSDFADVPEDHEWAVAIGWAQDMGIAVADEEGNFLPDDLLLRSSDEPEGEFQEFLNRYAVFAGIKLDDDELFIELDGEPDDIVMGEDAQEIFDGFFARLETALARRRD